MKKFVVIFLHFLSITYSNAQSVEQLIPDIKKYRFLNSDSCILLSEHALQLLDKHPNNFYKAIIYNSYATAYYAKGIVSTSDSLYELGNKYAVLAKNDTLQIFINNNRGLLQSGYGSFETSLKHFKQALKVATKAKIYREIADSYNNIAALYNYYEEPDSSEKYFQLAITAYEKEKERPYMAKIGLADIRANLGQLNFKQGKLNDAFKNLFSSLKIFEETKAWEKAAISANIIAETYFDRKELKKAKKYALLSMAYDNKKTRAETRGNIYFILGKIAQESHQNDSAYVYYDKALKIYEEYNLYYDLPLIYNSIGALYESEKMYSKAEYYFQKAVNINLEVGDSVALSINYINLTQIHLKKNEPAIAKNYIDKSLEILSPEVNYSMFVDAYGMAAETYKLLGNFQKAYEYLSIHSIYKDSLRNENNIKSQEEIEAVYQTEKKQKEIERQNAINEKKSLELKLIEEKSSAQSFQLKLVLVGGILLLVSLFFVIRSNLQRKKINRLLAQKNDIIYKQKEEVEIQREELHLKNHIIEEKQKEILDSINYAKRIQYTLLANEQLMNKHLPEHFVFFQPKDIVSGDFYWATQHNDSFYLAICDSTGHGVPGAFMSLLNISFLNEAINEKNIEEPGKVLDYVRNKLIENISQDGGQDGMDGVLIQLTKKNGTFSLNYAAAHNAPVVIRKNEIIDFSYDKMPIGKSEKKESFKTFQYTPEAGDLFFLFTDGYPDQFGGEKGKKLKLKNMIELLRQSQSESLVNQKRNIENKFNDWKGDLEQVDDVLLACIRF